MNSNLIIEKAKKAISLLSVEVAALRAGRVTEQVITTNVCNTLSSLPALPSEFSELARLAPNLANHISFIDLEATRTLASAALQTAWTNASASALAAAAAASAAAVAAGSQVTATLKNSTDINESVNLSGNGNGTGTGVTKRNSSEEVESISGGGGIGSFPPVQGNITEVKMIAPDSATRHPPVTPKQSSSSTTSSLSSKNPKPIEVTAVSSSRNSTMALEGKAVS